MITAFHVVVRPANAPDLGLLAHYFYGYSVSWPGIGVGFVMGICCRLYDGLVRRFRPKLHDDDLAARGRQGQPRTAFSGSHRMNDPMPLP